MLVLTRRIGETLFIGPHPDATGPDPTAWFTRPIAVRILRVDGNHVRVGIEAAEGLRIWREERGRKKDSETTKRISDKSIEKGK